MLMERSSQLFGISSRTYPWSIAQCETFLQDMRAYDEFLEMPRLVKLTLLHSVEPMHEVPEHSSRSNFPPQIKSITLPPDSIGS